MFFLLPHGQLQMHPQEYHPASLHFPGAVLIPRSGDEVHPPKAQPKVKKILTSFHEGISDREEFWFNLHGERFIHLQYIAVRCEDGTYLGCLEVGQDATYLRSLKDEKRR